MEFTRFNIVVSPLTPRRALVATSLFVTSLAHAGPTGLALMPIADILKHREASAAIGLTGTERNVSKGYVYFQSVTIGLFDRIEVGYDTDFMGSITGNAKLQLFEGVKALPNCSASVGVTGWRGDAADPYIVGRYDGKGYRLHGGFWRTMDTGRLMLGSDFPVTESLVGSVEFLSGPGSQAWGALTYALPNVPGLQLMACVGVPCNHSDGVQHSFQVIYGFKL